VIRAVRELDRLYMRRALTLARMQLGRTAPNPAVGCVIVLDGKVVGEGATGDGGRPHAEEIALAEVGAEAGAEARVCAGATVYVSLEPCARRSHGGLSCAQRLIEAGAARVLAACEDPHPHAAGAGLEALRRAGVQVEVGLEQEAAAALIAGFAHRLRTGRPLAAIDTDPHGYDGQLALEPGETLDAALQRLGAAGLNRVYAVPDSAAGLAIAASRSDAN